MSWELIMIKSAIIMIMIYLCLIIMMSITWYDHDDYCDDYDDYCDDHDDHYEPDDRYDLDYDDHYESDDHELLSLLTLWTW